MNSVTVTGIITGTASSVILLLIGVIKLLVADHLKQIRETLVELKEGQSDHQKKLEDHSGRLTTIETTLRLNGCLGADAKPRCGV